MCNPYSRKRKYLDIDILSFLGKAMHRNTRFYKSDFDIDKDIFQRYAASEHEEDKVVLWMSRTHGTVCVKEHDVFVRNSPANTRWRYYAEHSLGENYLAFAVEITGSRNGVLHGNVFEMDYSAHAKLVAAHAVPLHAEDKTFADGYILRVQHGVPASIIREAISWHGRVIHSLAVPEDAYALEEVLAVQKNLRTPQVRKHPILTAAAS